MRKIFSNRGEIATLIAIISMGLMLMGLFVGKSVVKQKTQINSKANECPSDEYWSCPSAKYYEYKCGGPQNGKDYNVFDEYGYHLVQEGYAENYSNPEQAWKWDAAGDENGGNSSCGGVKGQSKNPTQPIPVVDNQIPSCTKITNVTFTADHSPVQNGDNITCNVSFIPDPNYPDESKNKIGCGWSKNGNWPIMEVSSEDSFCSNDNCTFYVKMDPNMDPKSSYDLVGFDMRSNCPIQNSYRVPISQNSNSSTDEISTPIPTSTETNKPPITTSKKVSYIPGSSTKICQLTGEFDRTGWNGLEKPPFAFNKTESRYGIKGTDLGSSFEHNGNLYFLFGDTLGNAPFRGADSIAYSTDTNPDSCITLNFLNLDSLTKNSNSLAYGLNPFSNPAAGKISNFLPITIPGISTDDFEVPSGGFSANGKMYIFYTTGHTEAKIMGRSILAASTNNGQSFNEITDISNDKFINIAPVLLDNSEIYGVPQNSGQGVLMWGSGTYRKSNPYLAYAPLDTFEDHSSWSYFTGMNSDSPSWSNNESDATPLFDQPCVGELSVTWNQFLNKWLMLYNCDQPRGINFRVADQPWRPWSQAQVLFNPWADGGYCHFIHASSQYKACFDNLSDPKLGNEWGGEYAPYVISRFTTGNANETTIYFVMSTWNPYQVVLMKSTLKLE